MGTARLSVVSNTLLVIIKLLAGIFMGSVSVISEALHSGVDLVAAVAAFFSVRVSGQPADVRHPFGHGKFESLAGMLEGALIVVAAFWILYASVLKISTGAIEVTAPLLGVAVMAFSSLVNLVVSSRLFRVGRETDSIALQADAWHLRTDVYTTTGVLAAMLGIALGRLLHLPRIELLDPLAAIAVALVIIQAGVSITRESLHHLADEALPSAERQAVERLLQEHYADFLGYHELRTRKAGPDRHIDLHLSVPPNMPVGDAHALCDHLETDLQRIAPGAHVLIHVEPEDVSHPTPPGAPPPRRSPRRSS